MKKMCRPIIFLIFLLASFLLLDAVCYDGSSYITSTMSDTKGDHYDVVFIGASKFIHGVSPVIMNEAMGISSANYSISGVTEEFMYETLRFLLRHYSVDSVVLDGVRIWDIAERRFRENLQAGSAYRIYDSMRDPFERIGVVLATVPNGFEKLIPEAFTQLFRDLDVKSFLKRLNESPMHIGFLGYDEEDVITKDFVNIPEIAKNYREDYQEFCPYDDLETVSWIEKTIQLARENGVTVYLSIFPNQEYYKGLGKRLCAMERLANKYDNVKAVWNLSGEMVDIGLINLDFYNMKHLNRMGAAKNTEYIISLLSKDMGITPDYSKVAMYRGENLEPIGDDLYRYTVDVYPNTEIRFQYMRGEEIVSETEYGETKVMELHKLGADEKLNFCVRPKVVYEDTFPVEERCYSFLLTPDALEMEERSKEVSAVGDGDQK